MHELRKISSVQNPLVKHLVKLRENRSYREENRRATVSGNVLVKELSSIFKPLSLYVLEEKSLEGAPFL